MVDVRCADWRHRGGRIRKSGRRTDQAGRVFQVYECIPLAAAAHRFRLPVDDAGAPLAPQVLPAACPKHPDAHVVRNGSYGHPVRKQRYMCTPVVGNVHHFTQQLPRQYIGTIEVKCESCEEPIGIHRGEQASSRRAKWPARAVAECLKELADGVSYSQASLNVLYKTWAAQRHALQHQPNAPRKGLVLEGAWDSENGPVAWHLAADLLEQYGPVVYEKLTAERSERDRLRRARNDEMLAAREIPPAPIVWALDEVPVHVRRKGGKAQVAWTLHTVVEILWDETAAAPSRVNRLRLARALPGVARTRSWQLVLSELDVRPDVVVSDFGGAIAGALRTQYEPGTVAWVPSLFHFNRAMEDMAQRHSSFPEATGERKKGAPQLLAHLRKISRDELVRMGRPGWHAWWDELERIAKHVGVKADVISTRRALYEKPITAAITTLEHTPMLPVSNAAVEAGNRAVENLLSGRMTQFRNIERTNALLDLAVCREAGVFNDMAGVRELLRADNTAWQGWNTPRRSFDDHQPPVITDIGAGPYVSLYDTSIVTELAAAR